MCHFLIFNSYRIIYCYCLGYGNNYIVWTKHYQYKSMLFDFINPFLNGFLRHLWQYLNFWHIPGLKWMVSEVLTLQCWACNRKGKCHIATRDSNCWNGPLGSFPRPDGLRDSDLALKVCHTELRLWHNSTLLEGRVKILLDCKNNHLPTRADTSKLPVLIMITSWRLYKVWSHASEVTSKNMLVAGGKWIFDSRHTYRNVCIYNIPDYHNSEMFFFVYTH